MAMTPNELLQALEKILQIPPGSAHTDAVLADQPAWDSMGVMEFIIWVDDHFGISLPAHQIGECRTIGDLMALCGSHVTN
ncbi:MAG: acyl carrier protein [Verrucomicrobiaceae bacterium]|jgi:acyl carrier protein|nr:acyl carrier protein [Verrucomicrobiaceae bacterium]